MKFIENQKNSILTKYLKNYFPPEHPEHIEFLNKQLLYLKPKERKKIIDQFKRENFESSYEIIAELVFVAFWKKLGWFFQKDPNINGKTPDFLVSPNLDNEENEFVAEVTVVREKISWLEEIKKPENGVSSGVGLVNQAPRFAMKIDDKYRKYGKIIGQKKIPFVLCFFIGSDPSSPYPPTSFWLDNNQIRETLFGKLTVNYKNGSLFYNPSIFESKKSGEKKNGVMAFEEYKYLSAVVLCYEKFTEKAGYEFSIYLNPLGVWAKKEKSPFSSDDFTVICLDSEGGLPFIRVKPVYFY